MMIIAYRNNYAKNCEHRTLYLMHMKTIISVDFPTLHQNLLLSLGFVEKNSTYVHAGLLTVQQPWRVYGRLEAVTDKHSMSEDLAGIVCSVVLVNHNYYQTPYSELLKDLVNCTVTGIMYSMPL